MIPSKYICDIDTIQLISCAPVLKCRVRCFFNAYHSESWNSSRIPTAAFENGACVLSSYVFFGREKSRGFM